MGMPRNLKNFAVFLDGVRHIGECTELSLPKLSRKVEAYRAGGMLGEVSIDLGMDKLEADLTYGGLMYDALRTFGTPDVSGVLLRFAGAYQRDEGAAVDAVEVVMRGRFVDFDFGKQAAGSKTEFKNKFAATYYKMKINGTDLIEIDLVNLIEVIGGVDRQEGIRRAIGLGNGVL